MSKLTPVRARLAEAIKAKSDFSKQIEVLSERISRLERAVAEAAPLEDELRHLVTREAAFVEARSAAGEDLALPADLIAKRRAIVNGLETVRATSAAAQTALTRPRDERNALSRKRDDAARWIEVFVGEVIVDELGPALEALRVAVKEAESVRQLIMAGREAALSRARTAGDDGRSVLLALEAFDKTLYDATHYAPPAEEKSAHYDAAFWSDFAAKLASDPGAEIEDLADDERKAA